MIKEETTAYVEEKVSKYSKGLYLFLLGENKSIYLNARGFSMHPFIKNGDRIKIAPISEKEIRIGDVIAYKSNHLDQIVCHRLVRKTRDDQGWLLYTRGDASLGTDGPISRDMLIGRVVIILRGKKVINLTGRWRLFINLLIVQVYPYIRATLKTARKIASFILRLLQQFFFYRKIARFLFYDKVDCYGVKSEEDEEKFCRFYQVGIPFDLKKAHTSSNSKMPLLHRFIALYKDKVIGVATLVEAEEKSPYPGWWVHSFYVLLRFGGAGIEQKLMQEVTDFASERKASKIQLAIKDRGIFTCRPYQELGFSVRGGSALGRRKVSEKVIGFGSNSSFNRYFLMEKELE